MPDSVTRAGSSAYLEAISAAARDGILIIDSSGRIVHWNQAASRIFGYSAAEVLGESLHDLLAPPRLLEVHRRAFARFKVTGQGIAVGQTLELPALHRSGEEIPIELSLSATQVDGEWCAVGIVREIEERKRIEERVRLERERAQRYLDVASTTLVALDPQARITLINRAGCEVLGWSSEELLGRDWFETAIPEEERAEVRAVFDRIVSGDLEPVRYFENAIVDRMGERRIFAWHNSVLFEPDGTISGLLSSGLDVTEKREAEAALRRSEARLQVILEDVPVGIIMVGLDQRIRWANRKGLAMVGIRDKDQLLGQRCTDYFCPALEDQCPVLDLGCVVEDAERELRRFDGCCLPILKSVHRVELGGEVVLLEAFLDMSKQKELESRLAQARRLEAVGSLAAGLAHEINTPIQYLGDNLAFLAEAGEDVLSLLDDYRAILAEVAPEVLPRLDALDEEVDLAFLRENVPQSFSRTRRGLERIASVVGAMRDFSGVDTKASSSTDLCELLQSTLTFASPEVRPLAEVALELGELPPVTCWRGELGQAFLALVLNAAQAIGDKGQGKGLVQVRAREEGEHVVVEIEDDGVGMSPALQERVFDPFFTTREVGSGRGQGLTQARSVFVDMHGGRLDVRSQEGVGTTFTVRLPLGRAC